MHDGRESRRNRFTTAGCSGCRVRQHNGGTSSGGTAGTNCRSDANHCGARSSILR
jgi:hypothetical protein